MAETDDMKESEKDVLTHILLRGDDTPKNMAEALGYHRNTVVNVTKDLESEGLVSNKGGGVYSLTEAGLNAARVVARARDNDI